MPITEARQKMRALKITASQVPEIIARPFDAWAKMTGRVEPTEAGDAAVLGTILEPAIINAAEHFGGFKVARSNIWRVAGNGEMGATLDAQTTDGDIVEAKTTALFNRWTPTDEWGEAGTDQVPERVMLQVVAQMICTPEAARAHVAAMIGRGFSLYTVMRDAELCGLVEERVLKFKRDHLDADTAPNITDGTTAYQILKRMDRSGKSVARLEDWHARQFLDARAVFETAEAEYDKARAMVLAGLGESEDGECPSGARFTYHKCKDGFKFDEKAFAAEHPELHAKYQALKPGYRTLRYSNKGKGK